MAINILDEDYFDLSALAKNQVRTRLHLPSQTLVLILIKYSKTVAETSVITSTKSQCDFTKHNVKYKTQSEEQTFDYYVPNYNLAPFPTMERGS